MHKQLLVDQQTNTNQLEKRVSERAILTIDRNIGEGIGHMNTTTIDEQSSLFN